MSTNAKEYKLAIRIAGAVDKTFSTSLASANAALKANELTIENLNKNFTKLDKGFNSIVSVGEKCFSAIATAAGVAATAIGAVTVASLTVGSEFESAYAGVRKTVDATEEEFAQLREDIIALTREIPSSASDIASTMEIAGQLGIDTGSLLDFTKTMINLGVATDLSSEEAADALARFANITNMENYGADGVSNYERLGSVIVDLGNNFATTESEIVSMATNIAATGEMVGLTEPQIMALATAMSATGIEAEKGGSAISKVLRKIQLAAETGSDSLNDYASVAGMTADEFAEAFETDAVGALSAFIEGLNDEERNGKSAIAVLNDMGLKEVRLTDVLLRLANAQGDMTQEEIDAAVEAGVYSDATLDASYSASLMGEALERANAAWDENVALANEANERYKTFESRTTVMKSAFEELGIAIYDNLTRTPAVEIVDGITESVQDFTDTGLDDWIDGINDAIPTLQRKAKNMWKIVSPIVDGALEFGEWTVDNGDYIIDFIVGAAAALAAYKTVSTGIHIASTLASLTTMEWAIVGVTAAIGAAVTAIEAYKSYRQDLVDQSLVDHFGDIALSMGEIQTIAEEIVSTGSMDGVREALSAFDDADLVADNLQDYVDELNLMNWKVSVGLELSEDEKADYQSDVESYIEEIQDWFEKETYAINLNLTATLGADSDVTQKVNSVYLDTYSELEALGDQYAQAVNDAFADGVLDPDESDEIAEIQQNMAKIQQEMATSEFEAGMIKLQMEYGDGTALDADSFMNLQSELAEQIETYKDESLESYSRNVAAINNTYEKGGFADENEYQAALDEAEAAYYSDISEALNSASGFQMNTLESAYGDEITAALDEVLSEYSDSSITDWASRPGLYFDSIMNDLESDKDLRTIRDVLEQRLDEMSDTITTMQEVKDSYDTLIDSGYELTESQQESYDNLTGLLERIEMMQGIVDLGGEGYWKALGEQMSEGDYSDYYNQLMESIESYADEWGTEDVLPDSLYDGIEIGAANVAADGLTNTQAQESIDAAVSDSYDYTQEQIAEAFGQNFEAESTLDVSIIPKISYGDVLESSLNVGAETSLNLPEFFSEIDSNADGGIIQNKELSWVAENGPESIIPLDGSQNAIDLWEKTGQLLGMESVLDKYQLQDAGQSYEVSYQPTLNFYGGAPTKEDLTDALSISQEEFDQHMEQFMKTHRRVSFK